MASKDKANDESPLSASQVAERFDKSPKGKIPKELQSMLLPEPKPYKYKGIDAERDSQSDVKPTAPMIPKWFGTSAVPCRDSLSGAMAPMLWRWYRLKIPTKTGALVDPG